MVNRKEINDLERIYREHNCTYLFRLLPHVERSDDKVELFRYNRIFESLKEEVGVDDDEANNIIVILVQRIISSEVKQVSAPLIREMINGIFVEKGKIKKRLKYSRCGDPYFIAKGIIRNPKLTEKEKMKIIYERYTTEFYKMENKISELELIEWLIQKRKLFKNY